MQHPNDGNLNLVTTEPTKGTANIKVVLESSETLDATYFEASLLSHIGDTTSQEGVTTLSADMETLSNWLTSYVQKKNLKTTHTTTVTGTSPTTSATIKGVSDGYYLIACDVPQGIAVERSLIQVVDGEEVSVELKADTQYVTKLVKNGESETYAASTSANMSDTLTYQITMPVTKVTDATRVTSGVLTDTIRHHSFTKSSFSMEVVKDNDTGEGTTNVANYTYAYTDNSESAAFTKTDGQETKTIANVTFGTEATTNYPTFTITFTAEGIADLNYLASENNIKIVVTYDAVLGSDAVNENKNTANWKLGKGPYTYEGSDETLVYTYGIDIDKTFSDNQTATHARNVHFEIYAVTGEQADILKVVEDSVGKYHVDNNPTADPEVKLTPDKTGNLVLTGLKEGTYTLKEVATADDFQLAGDVTITLTADNTTKSDLSVTSTAKIGDKSIVNKPSITEDTEESGTHISMLSMTILNQKGFNLPSTGGAGTWMFAIGGILLFAGAAAVFVAVSRKEDA